MDQEKVLNIVSLKPVKEANNGLDKLNEDIQEKLKSYPKLAIENPNKVIPELEDLKSKYTDIPYIYNCLYNAYVIKGDIDKAEKIAKENVNKNPDYLYAKINLAQIYLKNDKHKSIPRIFSSFDLSKVYPKRTKFHISEFAGFIDVVVNYYLKENQKEKAEKYYLLLKKVAPIYKTTINLRNKLYPEIFG